jgi:hypothetical protein
MSNYYQKVKEMGRLGSTKDHTWDREQRIHTCCKSKRSYYHKMDCPALSGTLDQPKHPPIISSDLSARIAELKAQDMTSAEVAAELSIPLVHVNLIYAELPITKDNLPRL